MRWFFLILLGLSEIALIVAGGRFLSWWVVLLGSFPLTGGFFLVLIWSFLAPSNRFFTFVNEGTAKVVVRGGQVVKVLVQLKGFTLDSDWNVVSGQERHLFGGLRWYGIWPVDDIYIYRFRWTNVLHDGTVQEHEPEWLDYILLKQDVYFFKEEEVEDKNLLPLEVHVLLTIQVVNPYKALFLVQDWLETVINRFRPTLRDCIAQGEYEVLVKQRGAIGSKLFGDSNTLLREFLDQYGVEVLAVEIKEINPSEEYRDETLLQWKAEQEEKRVRINARAEAARLRSVYGQIERLGYTGRLIRVLEALERTPAGVLTIHAVPDLTEVLREVFGEHSEGSTGGGSGSKSGGSGSKRRRSYTRRKGGTN